MTQLFKQARAFLIGHPELFRTWTNLQGTGGAVAGARGAGRAWSQAPA